MFPDSWNNLGSSNVMWLGGDNLTIDNSLWMSAQEIDDDSFMTTPILLKIYNILDWAESALYEFANRNALHVDVNGEVAKNKWLLQSLFDSLKWIKDDDSNQTWQWYWWYVFIDEVFWSYQVSMLEHPWKIEEEDGILVEEQIYTPWKWVNWIKFVRIKDKDNYIKEAWI